jgi:hypothetical protein
MGSAFDGLIQGLILIGVIVGVALCGLTWLLIWIFSHLTIGWV